MDETQEVANERAMERPSNDKEAAIDAKKQSRRRTKTGCLTCRRRRIKCGEEHPVCNNCIKSKRECEGYKQPVVFKHPAGEYHHTNVSATAMNAGRPYGGGYPPGFLPHLAASHGRPHSNYDSVGALSVPGGDFQRWTYGHQEHAHNFDPSSHYMAADTSGRAMGSYFPGHSTGHDQIMAQHDWEPSASPLGFGGLVPSSAGSAQTSDGHYWSASHHGPPQPGAQHFLPSQDSAFAQGYPMASAFRASSNNPSMGEFRVVPSSEPLRQESPMHVEHEGRYSSFGFVQQPSFNTIIPTGPVKTGPKTSLPPTPREEEDNCQDDEGDPWDVELDFANPDSVPLGQSQHDLNSMLVKYATTNERRSRTFMTFLDGPSVLATYRPSPSASPLNDERVARIFCHFVSVTGPCLSLFERPAAESTMTFSNSPVPTPQRTLWTYTMPCIALHHPALLHGMLALSALHISKLQETSEDPAIKHYTYAVRRIGKLLGLPKRRHETATLAANLLVGFYEVMAADHSKWNVHLAGAKMLVMEFDFASMTRTIRSMRSRARHNVAGKPAISYENWLDLVGIPESLLDDKDWEIDEVLVSNLTGYHVEYSRQYQPNFPPKGHLPDLTSKEIDDYKNKSDLYWWYCKQDVFQSMVSGDALLLPYRRWIYCPPRGQMGKPDAAYATMDHLVLIMARLTDFGGKDRVRKVKMVKAQGGQWRPPPHFFGHNKPPPLPISKPDGLNCGLSNDSPAASSTQQSFAQPNHSTQHVKASSMGPAPPSSSGPGFYGMMPQPTDPVEMHSAFYAMQANIHDQAFHDPFLDGESIHSHDSQTLDDETAAALKEHSEIIKSFDLFYNSLDESYQPLAADAYPSISTPFGPALQYRTFPMACVWAFYYVGRILIHRFHPHMPPAALVAAGVTAHQTNEYAQEVGRICAGLYCPQEHSLQSGNLNPNLGAALMESTFCLLFAAVQYQDAGQRGWTISKLRDIAQKTGWQTAAAIAAACEASWEKMGEAGKGPPYKTTMDRHNIDLRVRRKNKMSDGDAGGEDGDKHFAAGLPTHSRNAIHTHQSTRVHWALGLLSVEKDIEKLRLDED